MKALKIFSLFIGLIILGNGTFAARGQDTIEQAIRQVNSITDPNPVRQNQLRAEEAKKIIMARIRTTNPDGQDETPEFERLNDELDALRNRQGVGGEELINWTWEKRAGRCDEQVNLMKKILEAAGVKVTVATSTLNHTFLIVNLAPNAELDIPWTWGENAIAPDSWLGKTLKPEDSWKAARHFDYGRGFVGTASAPYSARQYLQNFQNIAAKNPDVIQRNCQRYREMLNNYFKIPEVYRKSLEFRPKEDIALEAGKVELEEIQKAINRMNKNDSDEIRRIHAWISDLDGRFGQISGCCEQAEAFRKKINAMFKLLPKLKTDASLGISDTGSDEVPDDIAANTGEVKVIQYFVFLLTNASNGLYVGSEDSLKGRTSCSFEGGGINCKSSDVVTYKKLSAPFASQEEAQAELCRSITESRIFPLAVGLKGRWQGGSNWYGLWDASISGCPK